MSIKLHIARSQLGTALSLFLKDKDPLSVQALACGGSEIMEGLANQSGAPTFTSHILETYPKMDQGGIRKLKNQYWNAIKHFYSRDDKKARVDEELMARFSDEQNDSVLFMGWWDYQLVTEKLPVEAQVFQVWWYATNEQRLNPDRDFNDIRKFFPNIMKEPRKEQKRRLARTVEKYREDIELLRDPRTENIPLIIPIQYP